MTFAGLFEPACVLFAGALATWGLLYLASVGEWSQPRDNYELRERLRQVVRGETAIARLEAKLERVGVCFALVQDRARMLPAVRWFLCGFMLSAPIPLATAVTVVFLSDLGVALGSAERAGGALCICSGVASAIVIVGSLAALLHYDAFRGLRETILLRGVPREPKL